MSSVSKLLSLTVNKWGFNYIFQYTCQSGIDTHVRVPIRLLKKPGSLEK